jgi:hypothetical protein
MLDRKEFLSGIAGVTVALVVQACGGDDSEGNPTGGGNANCNDGVDAVISSNHGHTLSIPAADFDAGESKTYSIQGTSAHNHSVTLSAQDFTDLKAGKKIAKDSTSDSGHTHSLQINC